MVSLTASRRRIFQGLAGAAAGLMLPHVGQAETAAPRSRKAQAVGRPFPKGVELPSVPPKKPKPDSVGIALVGLGLYALDKMAPAIAESEHCHLAGLVSGNPEKAQKVASAYGVPKDAIYGYENFEGIAKDRRIDAVYIVLPSGLHAEWTIKGFAAGKHVLCEKPMALSSAECVSMIQAGQRANRKLMIGYRCHFEPNNLHAMALMKERAVGKIQVIRTDQHYNIGGATPADNWRVNGLLAGGGALEDYGIYGLQAALYLTGELPSRVSAATTTPIGDPTFREIPNLVASRFTFPSGTVAQMASSYRSAWNDRVEVRGENGIFLMDPATAYQGHNYSFLSSARDGALKMKNPKVQFAAMMDHFGESIRKDLAIKTDGEMGLRDLRLIEAIYSSAKSGREVLMNW